MKILDITLRQQIEDILVELRKALGEDFELKKALNNEKDSHILNAIGILESL